MSENLTQFLAEREAEWKERAKVSKEAPTFENLPDGKYLLRVSEGRVEESKNGRPQTCIEFIVVSGDQEGEMVRHYTGLDKDISLEYLARDLARFGYDPEQVRFSQLPALLAEVAERENYVRARLVTKKGFQNVYIDQVMPEGWEPEKVAGKEEPAKPTAKKKTAAKPDPESAVEPEDDGDDAKPGMKVKFKKGSKEMEGVILEIDDEAKEADIESGGRTYTVAQDNLIGIIPEGTDS